MRQGAAQAGLPWRQARRQLLKAAAVCLALAALCVLVDRVYALFAHGIASVYMDFMFLYPLLGGVLVYGLLAWLAPAVACHWRWRATTKSAAWR